MSSNYWIKKKGNKLLSAPPPNVADTALELLLESQLQQNYKYHMMVVTRLVQFLWRDQIWKGAGFLFTLPVRIPFWGLGEYETLIIAFSPCCLLQELEGNLKYPQKKLGLCNSQGV